MKIDKLKASLAKVEDPRRTDRGHVLHKLEDILIIGLCTFACNGSDFADMEEFGTEREEWLKNFLELPNGIPNSDTMNTGRTMWSVRLPQRTRSHSGKS